MGNRWLLFKQREHVSWFGEPIQKLTLLLAAATFYTAPVTVAFLLAWFAILGVEPDWRPIQIVSLANVICVLFVTHVYERVFLIKEREGDQLRVSQLEGARAEAELQALSAQVDPHFLFNCLNTLGSLIEVDPGRAARFNANLASVYRYLLSNRSRNLVQLSDELRFLKSYVGLLEMRFGDMVSLEIDSAVALDPEAVLIPPTALQVLVENAVKHNGFSAESPLRIHLHMGAEDLEIHNPRRPKARLAPSEGVGLRNLGDRYRLATGREIDIESAPGDFRVRLPLIALGGSHHAHSAH